MNLIVNMRIYDVLLALLAETNRDVFDKLVEAHSRGDLMGPLPYLNLSAEE